MRARSAEDLERLAFRAIDRGDANAARRYLETATKAHVRDAMLTAWRAARTPAQKQESLVWYFADAGVDM